METIKIMAQAVRAQFFYGLGKPTEEERARSMAAHPAGKGQTSAPARHRHATGDPHKPESDRTPKHSAEVAR